MRIGTRVGPVGISGRVPTPTGIAEGATSGLGALISLPIQLLTVVVQALTLVLYVIGFLLKLLFVWLPKALWWLAVIVFAPIWAPIRGWWRHHNKNLVRKVERRAAKAHPQTQTQTQK